MKTWIRLSITIGITLFLITDCKKEEKQTIPFLTTRAVSDATTTSATCGGSITSDGGSAIIECGVCCGTLLNPTTNNSATFEGSTTSGSGTRTYVSYINGLTPSKMYRVRAYATNAVGTAYGNEITFTTLGQIPAATTEDVSNLSPTGVTLNATVNASDLLTTIVFEYGTTSNYGSEVPAEPAFTTKDTTIYASATLTDLTHRVEYHYRVKAINALGTTYGSDRVFTISDMPVLTTAPVSEITAHSAVSGGSITDDGGAPITVSGVYWTTDSAAAQSHKQCIRCGIHHTQDGTGSWNFTSYIEDLQPATTYYIYSYAVNNAVTSFGNVVSFTTLPPCSQVPLIGSLAVTNISSTGATLSGSVNANGYSTTVFFECSVGCGRGCIWKDVTAIQSPVTGTDFTNVSANISDLKSGIGHKFYIIATNTCAKVKSAEMTFTTPW